VVEDLLRRERLAHPYTGAHFWRTASGDEADLVIERGDVRHAFEVKAGSGRDLAAAKILERCVGDLDAKAGWLIGQSRGIEPLLPSVTRRGYDECIDWLP
jgi:hypothetical protein